MTQAWSSRARCWRPIGWSGSPNYWRSSSAASRPPGRRWGAYLLMGDVTAQVGIHLAVGVAAYRDVMRRAWPTVAPLEDWDDG